MNRKLVVLVAVVVAALLAGLRLATARASGDLPQPVDRASRISGASFGMTMHGLTYGRPWPSVKFGALRLWDSETAWSQLNPARGQYNWKNLDTSLSAASAHGVEVLYTFGRTPGWASSQPEKPCSYTKYTGEKGCNAPPRDLADWDTFLRAIATHAAGRIKYWEIWNEPNLPQFWTGDVPTLAAMAEHAYHIIKEVDPAAKVLTPSPTDSTQPAYAWMDKYLSAGGGAWADIISFHGYVMNRAGPEDVVEVVRGMREVAGRHGQAAKPLWDTEGNWGKNSRYASDQERASYLARWLLVQYAAGVDRVFWYAWDNGAWGTLWKKDSGAGAPAIAYDELQHWIAAATVWPCREESDIWSCRVKRAGGDGEIVWASQPTDMQATGPATYVDLTGHENQVKGAMRVGPLPVLLRDH